jgi:predicted metal-dependent peptidase
MKRESEAMRAMRDAREDLLLGHPFFGVLSLKAELVEDASIKTASINSKRLRFNPDYVLGLSNAKRKGLWAHEISHPALGHGARMGRRDPELWNQAADYAINGGLIAEGFELPDGALVDPRFENKRAESIYTTLESERNEQEQQDQAGGAGQSQGQGGAGDPGGKSGAGDVPGDSCGQFESEGAEDSSEAAAAINDWAQNVSEAIRAASSAGKLPAGVARMVAEVRKPKADWRALLRRFLTDQVKTESTWSKPNKRFFPGLYLPGRRPCGLGSIVVGVDTSGSIDAGTLAAFSAEITAICQDIEPEALYVVYCDAQVNKAETYEPGDTIKLQAVGGGGTRFKPVFEWVEAQDIKPAALVYLTDLMCSEWPTEPGYPVLWASYGAYGAIAPMGETVAID